LKRIPSLSALQAFEAAATHGSLKEAANQLNITPSAISHQIRRLEKDLNIELFERTKSGVLLTSVGKYYLGSIRSALELINEATQTVSQQKDIQVLNISTLSTLSTLWLIPKLKTFHQKHPNIKINLLDDINISDFSTSDLDAAIRYDFYGRTKWPGLISIPLIEEYIMPVCGAEFLKQHPHIDNLDGLIKSRLLTNYRHPDEWQQWLTSVEADFSPDDLASQIILDTSNMTLTAATNNLGVALGRTPFIDSFLNNKQLIRLNPKIQFRGTRHYLVFPEKTNQNRNFKKFKTWIASTANLVNGEYRQLMGEIFV